MSNVYSVLNERMTRKNDLDMKCAYAYACALTENIYNEETFAFYAFLDPTLTAGSRLEKVSTENVWTPFC